MNKQLFSAVALSCLLVACGGGGGGGAKEDPANLADGLGADGHAAGTVDLGFSGTGWSGLYRVASALADDGRALVVWRTGDSAGNTSTYWSQSSAAGAWSAAAPLPQVSNVSAFYGVTLRMNPAGNAVLGWVNQERAAPSTERSERRAARFIQGQGWDAGTYDVSGGTSSHHYGFTSSWDLSMLDDDSFTSTVTLPGASTGSRYGVSRTVTSGAQAIALLTADQNISSTQQYAAFAPKPDGSGYGLLYHAGASTSSPGQIDINAQLASVHSGAFAVFPVGTYRGLCYTSAYDEAIVAATSPLAEGVLAVVTPEISGGTGSCNRHNLQLIRVYTSGSIMVTNTRANTAGTSLPVAPVVAVDQAGNAIAVWKESTGTAFNTDSSNTYRLMWSQSLHGQPWSTPQALISNLGDIGRVGNSGHIALAMNASGQAVAAVLLQSRVAGELDESIAVGNFSFSTGWTPWKRVANKLMISEPHVSINASGQGLVTYTGYKLKRVGGKAPTSISGPYEDHAFAWRF